MSVILIYTIMLLEKKSVNFRVNGGYWFSTSRDVSKYEIIRTCRNRWQLVSISIFFLFFNLAGEPF